MRTSMFLGLCLLFVATCPASGQERELLYPASVSDKFKEVVDSVRDLKKEPVPYDKLTPKTDYFVRIAPRKVILNEKNELVANALLGTKPFVFFTTPQGVTGKSLLKIYEDIGYEAEDIINWQRGQEMVAIVFRFPDSIKQSEVKDGTLPDNWDKSVLVPTWDNACALMTKLSESATIDPKKNGEFQPEKLFFRSDAEKAFVLSYPKSGVQRLRETNYVTYETLKVTGGSDWTYRKLLEDKLSIFAHFRGTGRTLNVVIDPYMTKPDTGIFEFVGPNTKLKDLPEVAVIHLGKLIIEDSYTIRSSPKE